MLFRSCLYYNWKFWPFNVSLAGRQLSHGVAAEYGTGGRLGWQSASVTLNGSINYIKGISQGTLRIDARSIHTGRKTIVVETKVTNEENDLIASGTFTMYKVGDL